MSMFRMIEQGEIQRTVSPFCPGLILNLKYYPSEDELTIRGICELYLKK